MGASAQSPWAQTVLTPSDTTMAPRKVGDRMEAPLPTKVLLLVHPHMPKVYHVTDQPIRHVAVVVT